MKTFALFLSVLNGVISQTVSYYILGANDICFYDDINLHRRPAVCLKASDCLTGANPDCQWKNYKSIQYKTNTGLTGLSLKKTMGLLGPRAVHAILPKDNADDRSIAFVANLQASYGNLNDITNRRRSQYVIKFDTSE